MSNRLLVVALFMFPVFLFHGCTGNDADSSGEQTDAEEPAPMPVAPAVDGKPEISIATLRKRLGANSNAKFTKAGGRIIAANLARSGVRDIGPLEGLPLKYLDLTLLPITDLSALKGMPLEELYLEGTKVTDLSPLAGMPLKILRMEHVPVEDISPIAGMKLLQLNLYDTKVKDISVVRGMPLNTLWIPESKVDDISVLDGMKLESLDLRKTAISDLSPIAGNEKLLRLNIAESEITDLTPLQGLHLQRLIFTPEKIRKGIEIVRNMPSLRKIGPSFDEVVDPATFWANWNNGKKNAGEQTKPAEESQQN